MRMILVVGVGVPRVVRLYATAGMFLRVVLVFRLSVVLVPVFATAAIARAGLRLCLASTARAAAALLRRCLGQKLLPAMLAAKVKRLAITPGAQGRRFIHRHAADWIGLHKDVRCSLSMRSSASFTLANAEPEILLHRNFSIWFADGRQWRLPVRREAATLGAWQRPKTRLSRT
jgi:hypothetical protein